LRSPIHWTEVACDAARFGWQGDRPSFLRPLSLDQFQPKHLPDQLWIEQQIAVGRSLFAEVPDDQLPFVEVDEA